MTSHGSLSDSASRRLTPVRGDDPECVRVCCVDDDPDLVGLTAASLERYSDRIECQTATSAPAALALLDDGPVDCVVSDYQMAPIDGLAFLDRVRTSHGDLPFVLFTARGSEEIASDAISAGVTDYLQKESGTDQYAVLANRIEHIVDEHRAKAALEESERMLATLVANVPGMVYRCRNDPDWTMTFVSEGCLTLTGYEPSALESGAVSFGLDLIHPDDRENVWDAVQRSLDDRQPFELSYRLRRRDGTVRWVYEQGTGVYEGDDLVALEGVISDVTELKHRERDAELAETLFENTQDALFVIDVDEAADAFRFERVNPAYERHTGLTNEALTGRSLPDVFGETDGEAILDHYRECVARREPLQYEERLSIPGPGTCWETRIAPVVIDGEVQQLVGATRDVTARKLREAQDDAIFNQAYQLMGLLEPDGTILRANEAALAFGGLGREDVVGHRLWETDWFAGDTAALVRDLVERAADGEFVRTEFDATGDRGVIRVDFSIKPVTDERGEVVLLVPEGRDITERRRHEQELERQNARLERFASVVSHDLRNPLVVARGSLHLARESHDPADFERVEAALERMDTLIDGLLSLSRDGQPVEETRPVSLERVVSEAWQTVPTDGATLDVSLDGYTVEAEEQRLRQLLENLLANCVEHGTAGRQASASDGEQARDAERETGGVRVHVGRLPDGEGFFVADDGPGLPDASVDDLFEYGYSTSDDGTGFGLAIVRGIAEAHGWRVVATESASGGARFEIRVEAAPRVPGVADERERAT
jgi:PAS domain S-box-containing protein